MYTLSAQYLPSLIYVSQYVSQLFQSRIELPLQRHTEDREIAIQWHSYRSRVLQQLGNGHGRRLRFSLDNIHPERRTAASPLQSSERGLPLRIPWMETCAAEATLWQGLFRPRISWHGLKSRLTGTAARVKEEVRGAVDVVAETYRERYSEREGNELKVEDLRYYLGCQVAEVVTARGLGLPTLLAPALQEQAMHPFGIS